MRPASQRLPSSPGIQEMAENAGSMVSANVANRRQIGIAERLGKPSALGLLFQNAADRRFENFKQGFSVGSDHSQHQDRQQRRDRARPHDDAPDRVPFDNRRALVGGGECPVQQREIAKKRGRQRLRHRVDESK